MLAAVGRLDTLDVIAAAARRGEISRTELELVANAAAHNPAAQQRLLDAKAKGLAALKAECIRVRRETETDDQTRTRLQRQRNLRMWTDPDNMLHIHATLDPNSGGIEYTQLADAIRHAHHHIRRQTSVDEQPRTIEQTGADVFVTLLRDGLRPPPADDDGNDDDNHIDTDESNCTDHDHDHDTDDNGSDDDTRFDSSNDTEAGDSATSDLPFPVEDQASDTNPGAETYASVGHRSIDLRELLARWRRRGAPCEFIISLDALQRGAIHDDEVSELVGAGEFSPQTIRDLLPRAFIKLIVMRGPRNPIVVCHAGRRASTALLHALGTDVDPPEPGDRTTIDCRTNIVINIVLDADAIDGYHPDIRDIVERRGKRIPPMIGTHRHINAHLRTALLVSGHTCTHPGCTSRHYLEIDHTVERSRGGPTAWHNLRYLCWHHHTEKTRRYNNGRYDHPRYDSGRGNRRPHQTAGAGQPATFSPASRTGVGDRAQLSV